MGHPAYQQQQESAPAQLARLDDVLTRFSGTFSAPMEVQARLHEAAQRYNLVSPTTACGMVPEGCAVALSIIHVSVENDTYSTASKGGDDEGGGVVTPTGKRGLGKSPLDRISAGLGISWDARQSRRLDDGSHPQYCFWQVVGVYRAFDGSDVQIIGTKEMDLRDGSAVIEGLWERFEEGKKLYASKKWKYPPKDPSGQIRELRLHIASHAETKARLRAIRSLGVRTSYTVAELQQPFVVARLMFTGQTEDPVLRQLFAAKRADAMLGGLSRLYGAPALPVAPAPAPRLAPPPVGESMEDGASKPADVDPRAAAPEQGQRVSAPADATQEAQPRAQHAQGAPAASNDVDPGLVRMPGRSQVMVADATDRDLAYWHERLQGEIATGAAPQFATRSKAQLRAIEFVMNQRAGKSGTPAGPRPTGTVVTFGRFVGTTVESLDGNELNDLLEVCRARILAPNAGDAAGERLVFEAAQRELDRRLQEDDDLPY